MPPEAPDLLAALRWSLERGVAVELLYALAAVLGRALGLRRAPRSEVGTQVLATLEEGSLAWLTALAPIAPESVFALMVDSDAGSPPGARRTRRRGSTRSPRVGWEQALWLQSSFLGEAEGYAGLERAAAFGTRGIGPLRRAHSPLGARRASLASHGERARVDALLPWLDRRVPADAWMRFLLDNAYASAACFEGNFDAARSRLKSRCVALVTTPTASQIGLIALWTGEGRGSAAGAVQWWGAECDRCISRPR